MRKKTRIPSSDALPDVKPKWLSQRYVPIKDENVKVSDDYPDYAKAGDPIEWLRRLYWCSKKTHKSTYAMDPSDAYITVGPGDLDTFQYLKHYCNKHYRFFNSKGYEDRYFILHKQVKRFLPEEDKHFALPGYDPDIQADLI